MEVVSLYGVSVIICRVLDHGVCGHRNYEFSIYENERNRTAQRNSMSVVKDGPVVPVGLARIL
jgi:hypothetical protein